MPHRTTQARICGSNRHAEHFGQLKDFYDALLVDLDGTLIRGSSAIAGAAAALHDAGLPIMYVTNNASKAPRDVAALLQSLGFAATEAQVMTSAQAAIALALSKVEAGSKALVVGAPSFVELAAAAGFTVVSSADDEPDVVLQGLNKELTWSHLAEGALAIRAGALWIASNTDTTLPSERGLLPGNGSMVAALRAATAQEPVVAGKPGPISMEKAAAVLGAQRPLVVGDRLDTDIAGGRAANMDTLMVLTGVSTLREAKELPPELQPSFIADDLHALNAPIKN